MTRVANAGLAKALAANMSKRRVSSEKALQTVGDAENPRCEACGARSVYNEGKHGPFFYCEDECGWSINLKRIARQGNSRATPDSDNNFPKQGPSCPICNGKTTLRNGRNGPFYGCTKYPECKGTIDASSRQEETGSVIRLERLHKGAECSGSALLVLSRLHDYFPYTPRALSTASIDTRDQGALRSRKAS